MIRKALAIFLSASMIIGATALSFAEGIEPVSKNKSTVELVSLVDVETLPEGVQPIMVQNEDEMMQILADIEKENNESSSNALVEKGIEAPETFSLRAGAIGSNVVHKMDVFSLSSVGGRVVSEVSYRDNAVVGPYGPTYVRSINYHDCYTTGFYAFTSVSYEQKTAVLTNSSKNISVTVRGNAQVAITTPAGDFKLANYRFDKSYEI